MSVARRAKGLSLDGLPTKSLDARLVRCAPQLSFDAGKPPSYFFASGRANRLNPAGVDCLYFSEDEATANAEYRKAFEGTVAANQPKLTFYAKARLSHLLDLGESGVPVPIESIKESLPEWKWPRYPKSLTTVPAVFEKALRDELARARRPGDERLPEQAGADEVFTEGATNAIQVNAFETSAVAKRRCVEHYGCKCSICGFRFGEAYGPAGEGLIHVHHLVPLSSIRREYQVNPVKDLRPVCPNCHALIHRRTPPYSPEEVTSMLKRGGRH